jgi:xylulokinase
MESATADVPAHASECTLAIDLGTSGPKVAVVSVEGRVLACEIEHTPVMLLPGGGAEQDPAHWWQAICRAAQRLLDRPEVRPTAIVAVCCTSQWSGTVAVDRTGKPLSNAIIWMDARGAPYVKRITSGPLRIEGFGIDKLWRWVRLTGGIPGRSGKDSIAHIHFLKHERPEIYDATYKFLEPKDYLNLKLTGRFAASYDSIILHWVTDNRRIDRIAYHDGLLKMAGLDRAQLPDLKAAVDILGPLLPAAAADLGLAPGLPVVMGTPDLHSAAIGSGAVRDFEPHLYIGTSSWLTCHVPFKKTDLLHNMASIPSAIPGHYFIANEQETAGGCLNFLRDKILFPPEVLSPADDAARGFAALEALAREVPAGCRSLIFTPWLYGERTPVEDHTLRGGFHNLSLEADRGALVRAVMEGVAYNVRWLMGHVENFIKRPLRHIRLVGGGANSDLWCQICADVLNRTIHQLQDPVQANARGAGILAAVALGYGRFEDIAGGVALAGTYTPDPRRHRRYQTLYREFRQIYRKNRRIYARLNRPAPKEG